MREDIDDRIKRVLYNQLRSPRLSYNGYPIIGSITVRYRNYVDQVDSFMIEIGYIHRIPILHEDCLGVFRHLGTGENVLIKTPKPEELYANKWCTFLYRGSSRDLFDVYQISKTRFERATFRKCAIVDSLMRGRPKLHEINIQKLVKSRQINSALRNLLLIDTSTFDFDDIRQQVIKFSREHLSQLTQSKVEAIDGFYRERSFNPEPMDPEGILNEQIRDHPMIKRVLENLMNHP